MLVNAGGRRFMCDREGAQCTAAGAATGGGRGGRGGRGGGAGGRAEGLSPDGKRAAFIRDYNLWVREVASGKETQLTKDGVKDFGYATDNAGWTHSDRPIVRWSPDSKKIATYQQDQRGVGEMYLVDTQWAIRRAGLEVPVAGRRGGHHHPARDHRRGRPQGGPAADAAGPAPLHAVRRIGLPRRRWDDVQWSPDATQMAFVSTSRDHKQREAAHRGCRYRRRA